MYVSYTRRRVVKTVCVIERLQNKTMSELTPVPVFKMPLNCTVAFINNRSLDALPELLSRREKYRNE